MTRPDHNITFTFHKMTDSTNTAPLPSNAELLAIAASAAHIDDIDDAHEEGYPLEVTTSDILNIARAIITRYHIAPVLVPVPVSERLPGAEDLAAWSDDTETGPWCWCGIERDGGWEWIQQSAGVLTLCPEAYTHWLPAHALPLPEVAP